MPASGSMVGPKSLVVYRLLSCYVIFYVLLPDNVLLGSDLLRFTGLVRTLPYTSVHMSLLSSHSSFNTSHESPSHAARNAKKASTTTDPQEA
jgi:hypothetical protein